MAVKTTAELSDLITEDEPWDVSSKMHCNRYNLPLVPGNGARCLTPVDPTHTPRHSRAVQIQYLYLDIARLVGRRSNQLSAENRLQDRDAIRDIARTLLLAHPHYGLETPDVQNTDL